MWLLLQFSMDLELCEHPHAWPTGGGNEVPSNVVFDCFGGFALALAGESS